VSRGAKEAPIVRRRVKTATPTARAIVRRRLGARVNPRVVTASLHAVMANLRAEDLVPAVVVPTDLVAVFAQAVMAAVVDRADSDPALVVLLAWVLAEEIFFPKTPKWPR